MAAAFASTMLRLLGRNFFSSGKFAMETGQGLMVGSLTISTQNHETELVFTELYVQAPFVKKLLHFVDISKLRMRVLVLSISQFRNRFGQSGYQVILYVFEGHIFTPLSESSDAVIFLVAVAIDYT